MKNRRNRSAVTYCKHARFVVDADVRDVHGIRGCGYRGPAGRAHEAAHEAGEAALLPAAIRLPVLLRVTTLVRVSLPRALGPTIGARWGYRLHLLP